MAQVGRVPTHHRLSLTPLLLGAAAMLFALSGWYLTGLVQSTAGPELLAAVLIGIGVTTISGSSVGLYASIALTVIATQLPAWRQGPSQSAGALIGVAATLIVVHELARLSLDARRPLSFAPGMIEAFVARTVGLTVGVGLVVWLGLEVTNQFGQATADLDLGGPWELATPVAVAALSLPLSCAFIAQRFFRDTSERRRLVISIAALTGTVVICAVAAQIGFRVDQSSTPSQTATQTTATELADPWPSDEAPSPGLTRIPRFHSNWRHLAAALVVLIIALALLAQRRARPQLSTIRPDQADHSVSFVRPSKAGVEVKTPDISPDELVSMLEDALVDINTEPDPSRAVRFGYATIERHLSNHGLVRASHETEQELLRRSLRVLGANSEQMTTLTRSFEQARFSLLPISETQRTQASEAVSAISETAIGEQTKDRSPANPVERRD